MTVEAIVRMAHEERRSRQLRRNILEKDIELPAQCHR